MATNRPNLGLQIALIIFVLITIALAVSTFMFFKQNQEVVAMSATWEKKVKDAADEKMAISKEIDKLKTIVGKGPQDKVDTIVDEDFKQDMKKYGATFTEPVQTYPDAMKIMLDAYMKLQDQISDQKGQIAKLQDDNRSFIDLNKKTKGTFDEGIAAQTAELIKVRKVFDDDRASFEGGRTELAKQIEVRQKQNVDLEAAAKAKEKSLTATAQELAAKAKSANVRLAEVQKVDFDAPDGSIVRVNQREHTVWIDLGSADGLKRQTSFTVYANTVSNVAGKKAEAKGTIEVIRLIDSHLAEARITDDKITDPIMQEDKIMSPTFLAGQPQHFAIVGFVDLDGDHQSDLKQLFTLISNNGGTVDAWVDETGKRSGQVTPTIRMVVVGDRAAEGASADAMQATNRLLKEADDAHIQTMPLKDFLKYMGYQGRERSSSLQGGAPTSTAPKSDADSTFRKRP